MHISIYTDFAALIYLTYLIRKRIRGYKCIGLWHKTNNHLKIKLKNLKLNAHIKSVPCFILNISKVKKNKSSVLRGDLDKVLCKHTLLYNFSLLKHNTICCICTFHINYLFIYTQERCP